MEFNKFEIAFESLKLGEHDYQFLIDNEFFKSLDFSEIQAGKVVVQTVLTKTERLMQLEMQFKGEVTIPCDRCGDDLDFPIDFNEELVVKFGDEYDEDDGIIVLRRDEVKWNIAHYLYESIVLSLPSKRVHPDVGGESSCNEQALSILADKDNSEKGEDDIDPRWAALKKLK